MDDLFRGQVFHHTSAVSWRSKSVSLIRIKRISNSCATTDISESPKPGPLFTGWEEVGKLKTREHNVQTSAKSNPNSLWIFFANSAQGSIKLPGAQIEEHTESLNQHQTLLDLLLYPSCSSQEGQVPTTKTREPVAMNQKPPRVSHHD